MAKNVESLHEYITCIQYIRTVSLQVTFTITNRMHFSLAIDELEDVEDRTFTLPP